MRQPNVKGLARLLNLTAEEYKNLKHTPLVEEKNALGAITGYFTHISPDNDQALLKKIILTKSNFVWFSTKQVSFASNE